jgi:hypothetical protein
MNFTGGGESQLRKVQAQEVVASPAGNLLNATGQLTEQLSVLQALAYRVCLLLFGPEPRAAESADKRPPNTGFLPAMAQALTEQHELVRVVTSQLEDVERRLAPQ